MNIYGQPTRTIRWSAERGCVEVLDQTKLPHALVWADIVDLPTAEAAIRDMWVRGAPLIGVTAAYGLAMALSHDASDDGLTLAAARLRATRPTAVNLMWGLDRCLAALSPLPASERFTAGLALAEQMADEDAAQNEALGTHGLALLQALWDARAAQGATVLNILTHCNAGWLATVDWGTALAPIYKAHEAGIPLHIWVDETRPRNQGASLTARELNWHGIAHTVIADNAGGHLMQHGAVDGCIVGTDRTTANGDVCNKIGTYLKALAAFDAGIPFYVALPGPTIDWTLDDGKKIPIEARSASEVTHIQGRAPDGSLVTVQLTPDGSTAFNPGFDVTPARLVTALITERGVCPASTEGLLSLYPERRSHG